MARARRSRNRWGRHNDARRTLVPGFSFSVTSAFPIVKALLGWAWLELTEGWRSWFVRSGKPEPQIASEPAPATTAQ
jgi:hypothetical protein